MPQKRNYDLFEVMRANIKVFYAYQNQVQNIMSSLSSGYQRDLQLTKKPFVQGVNLGLKTIELLTAIIPAIKVHEDKLKQSMTADVYLTNEVYELVKVGKSLRQAYSEVKTDWHNKLKIKKI